MAVFFLHPQTFQDKARATTYRHILRNPDGWSAEAVREAQQWALNQIVAAGDQRATIKTLRTERDALRDQLAAKDRLLNTPEVHNFVEGVCREAAHQRARFSKVDKAGKAPTDWFWLVGFLAGKVIAALTAGDREKALHHCISTAAVLANWHANINGTYTAFRPGTDTPDV